MAETRPSSTPGVTSAPRSARIRILVADSEDIVASITADLLQDLGYDVTTIQHSMTGLVTAAQQDRPDLVVVDTMLSGSEDDGALIETVGRLGMPTLFTTGGIFTEPGVSSLAKPFSQTELAKAVQSVIDRVPRLVKPS